MVTISEERQQQLSPGLSIKTPVKAGSTGPVVLSGEQTIDGVACVEGDRVLIKDQASAVENGIYFVSTGAWNRAPDFDGARDVTKGTIVLITGGTQAGQFWEVASDNPVIPGTSSLMFLVSLTASSTLMSFLQLGSDTELRTVLDKLRDSVNVFDWMTPAEIADARSGAPAVDTTAKVQNCIDAHATTGKTIIMTGVFLCGALTPPNPAKQYTIILIGGIVLPAGETLTIPLLWNLCGWSGLGGSQFSSAAEAAFIRGSETSDPVLRVYGTYGKTIQNIAIEPPKFVGLELDGETGPDGCALTKLKNVSCTARPNVATSKPFVSRAAFWVDAEDCVFMAMTGSGPYSMEILQDSVAFGGSFLHRWKSLRTNARGILIASSVNGLSSDFVFEDPQIENPETGSSFFTFDNSSPAYLSSIQIIRPRIFDQVGVVYLLNNIGTGIVANVIVDDAEAAADTLLYFDPASKTIQEVSFKEHRVQPYGTALPRIIPPWMNYTRQFIDAIDTKLVAATRSPSQMPGVPLAVEQNPSQWGALAGGGATVTEKILAPDGSYTAGQIGGTNGGTVTLFGVATVLALNDWIIAGGWLQSSELDKRPANYRLDLAAGGNPYYINGTSNQTGEEIGLRYGPYNVGDQAWKFVLTALKITTEGTAPVFPRLFLRRDTDYGITNYWMPGMILVPARLGFTDAEVMALARSLTAWPSVCLSGDVALAPHQQLRLGGGAQLFSAPAVPTSGVFALGAQILHSDLAVGEPTGWRATVAGGATSTTRANTTVYAVGVWALWTTGTTVWECIVAGTSAGAAPSIVGKLPGDTVVDNTVTWRMMSLTQATLVALANL